MNEQFYNASFILFICMVSRDTVVSRVARDGPYIFMQDQKLRRAEIIKSQ